MRPAKRPISTIYPEVREENVLTRFHNLYIHSRLIQIRLDIDLLPIPLLDFNSILTKSGSKHDADRKWKQRNGME